MRRFIGRHRRSAAALTSLLYLVLFAGLPAVHALEDSEARAAIEASHSDDCPRAHDDAVCPTCGGATIGTATAPGYQPVTVLDIRCMVSAVLIPDQHPEIPAHGIRAPPML